MRLPKNVKLLDVEPSNVELSFARRVKKEVRIDPQLIGQLPEGLVMASLEVKAEKILVFLPSEESGTTLNSVTTTPIYLETMRKDTILFCKIISPPSIQPVEKRWPDVEVHLVIGVTQSSKTK
jgi:YbbR domain-containing protein